MARIAVRVTPGAREDAVVGWQDDTLQIRVRAPAERGKANDAVCRLIAKALGLPGSSVSNSAASLSFAGASDGYF